MRLEEELLDLAEEAISYVSSYFREKYGMDERLKDLAEQVKKLPKCSICGSPDIVDRRRRSDTLCYDCEKEQEVNLPSLKGGA